MAWLPHKEEEVEELEEEGEQHGEKAEWSFYSNSHNTAANILHHCVYFWSLDIVAVTIRWFINSISVPSSSFAIEVDVSL